MTARFKLAVFWAIWGLLWASAGFSVAAGIARAAFLRMRQRRVAIRMGMS